MPKCKANETEFFDREPFSEQFPSFHCIKIKNNNEMKNIIGFFSFNFVYFSNVIFKLHDDVKTKIATSNDKRTF